MCVYVGKSDNNSNAPENGPMEQLYVSDSSLVDSWGIGVSLSGQGVYTAVGSSHGLVYVYNTPTMLLLSPDQGGTISQSKHGDPIEVDKGAVDAKGTTNFGEIVKMAREESVKTVAVGGVGTGRVAVYQYDGDTRKWEQLGSDISANGDEFAISDNGTILAVKYRDTEVRVYQLDNNKSWQRFGNNPIVVEADKLLSLSISSNGKVLAVGAYKNTKNDAAQPGYVQLYEYISNKWEKMAVPLVDPDGRTSPVDFARSVSLSGDGMTLAVAAPSYPSTPNRRLGYVKVYNLSDPFPSAMPSNSPSSSPSKGPTMEPSKSAAPSLDPATAPSEAPVTEPSGVPSSSFRPSSEPSISRSPSIPPTDIPTSSTCESNCDCGTGSGVSNPFCTLAFCRFNCNCDEGGCDLSRCEYDCRCKGGNCNMNRCEENCQCEGRNCQMDNCIYNGRCNSGASGFGLGVGFGSPAMDRVVVVGMMLVGLAVGAFF